MFFGAAPFAGFANSYSKPESAPSHALRSPDNPSGTPCHLPLHRGGWGILQCATSAYIREGSRFCKIISLEDTPHGSLVPREQSAGTADGGIDGLVQHIKRTTQRLLGGSFLFSCKNQRTMLIKPAWPWLKTCHWQVFGALRRCAACISFTIASIGATNPLSRFYQSSLLRHYNW